MLLAFGEHLQAALRGLQDWTIRPQLLQVPGVSEINTTGGYPREFAYFALRGQGPAFGSTPGVVNYFAEVPNAVNIDGRVGTYFDMANIQVLAGPQGTLFGKNATGGNILFEPVKPQDRDMDEVTITRHDTATGGEYSAHVAGSNAIGRLTWVLHGGVRVADRLAGVHGLDVGGHESVFRDVQELLEQACAEEALALAESYGAEGQDADIAPNTLHRKGFFREVGLNPGHIRDIQDHERPGRHPCGGEKRCAEGHSPIFSPTADHRPVAVHRRGAAEQAVIDQPAETGEAGDGVAGDEVDVGDEMLSLSTRKSSSMRSSPSVTVPMPGTERPVAFSINGMALAMLASRPGARATVPPLRDPPLLTMGDMGMDHGSGGMDHGSMNHGGPADAAATGGATGAVAGEMDHAAMGHGAQASQTEPADGGMEGAAFGVLGRNARDHLMRTRRRGMAGLHGHRHRTGVVHGNQRQLHEEFVFQNVVQVRPRLQRQQIFFAFIVLGCGSGFVGHKTKPAVHRQRSVDGPQASLARQGHNGRRFQMQPDSRCAAAGGGSHLTCGLPADAGVRIGAFTRHIRVQALKLLQCFSDIETGARLGKSSGIEPLRIPR